MPLWSAGALDGLNELQAAYNLNPADVGVLQHQIDTYFNLNPAVQRHRFQFDLLRLRNAAVEVACDGGTIWDVQYGDG
jgi:hypothetical protein